MSETRSLVSKANFDAVLFDLDGVLTSTEKIHAACWKKMFDEFLEGYYARKGEAFRPFEIATDYIKYVDGKPRYDGVQSFLESRDIHLPFGDRDDPVDRETVCGLGNRKNEMVNEAIRTQSIEAFEGSVAWVHHLRSQAIKTAVVSSSANCRAVLAAAGIEGLFDGRVDGEVAARRGLPGKPAPDTFLAAAKDLGVTPERTVVVEDAISGVQAGRDGGFGLVVGVNRGGDPAALKENGADVVVGDLEEMLPP